MKSISMTLKRTSRLKVAILAVIGLVAGAGATSALSSVMAISTPTDNLSSTIDNILADPRLKDAQADVLVRSAKDGSVLYSRNASNRLIPASNTKLYTSTAALEVLGNDYKFSTTVVSSGEQKGSALFGNLYLKGTGDPTVQLADYDKLAASVAAAGIRTVTGKFVVDDTFFTRPALGNNWTWDNAPYYYQPEISALTIADANFNIGSTPVQIKPSGAVGQPAEVTELPETNFITIQNETTTGPAGSANTIAIDRKLGVNTIIVTGSIPVNSGPISDLSTVTDPSGYVGAIFRDALKRHGVKIVGETTRGSTPASHKVINERKSMPLSQLMPYFMKLSNNGIAEILVKTMGQKAQKVGSWDAGLASEYTALNNTGVDTSDIQLVDGSGLSNLNFTTPQETTDLLIAAQQKPWFKSWYDSLPVAGVSDPMVGGTLRSRMVNTKAAGNLHAKTGSLIGVSALSGYITSSDGELLVVSIMENNYIAASPKSLEDAIAITLANFSRNSGVKADNKAAIETLLKTKTDVKDDGLECSWTKDGC